MNVFVKPDEQRLSLLRLCHGEKMKVKPTIKLLWGAYCRVTSAICPPCSFIRKSASFRILTEKKHKHIFSSNDMSTMDEYAIRRYVATSQQANHDSPENVENLQRKTYHKMTGATTVYNLQCAPDFSNYAGIVLRYKATCYHHNDCPTCFCER